MKCFYYAPVALLLIQFTSCSRPLHHQYPLIPPPDHVVVVFLENHNYDQIMTDPTADFLFELIDNEHTALFTNSYAMGHPSQPNYLQSFSGSNQGVIDNSRPTVFFNTNNLGSNLIKGGYSFLTYAEDLPYAGFDGEIAGRYVRKHNPMTNWVGTGNNQLDSLLNQPLTSFPVNYDYLPTVSYIIPNLDNDMHDGTIDSSDQWLRKTIGPYFNYAIANNSLLIITFDEGSYDENGDHIFTIFCGEKIDGGIYEERIDHHNVLRTIEDLFNIRHSGNAVNVEPILDCWIYDWE